MVVAVNHNRAQILAPHREVDPWAGLDRSGESAPATDTSATGTSTAASADVMGMISTESRPPDPAWPEVDRPS